MDSLEQLERNVQTLLARYQQAQDEIQRLRELNENQREEIMQTHTELTTLRRSHRHLQTAMSMMGDKGRRDKAKQEINYIISLIDRALETIKQ